MTANNHAAEGPKKSSRGTDTNQNQASAQDSIAETDRPEPEEKNSAARILAVRRNCVTSHP